MSYIPHSIINKLKSLSILDVAERLGIQINSKGYSLCFMHNEKNPSLHINKKNNKFHCYGCSESGDVIKLVEKKLHIDFYSAVNWLIKEFHVQSQYFYSQKNNIKIKNQKENNYIKEKEYKPDVDLLTWVMDTAKLSPIGEDFLYNILKYKKEVVERCGIKSITYGDKFCKIIIKKFGLNRVKSSGLIKWNKKLATYIPTFECPCLLFPFYDEKGNIYNIQGRSLRKDFKNRFSWINHSETFIFNLPSIIETDENTPIYIAEGVTDCLAFLSEGKKAIAIPGAGNFKYSYLKYLKDKMLYMAADNDNSGQNLFNQIDNALRTKGNYLHRIYLNTKYKDYSDYYESQQYCK